jgi:hypothetical protein
MSYLSDFAARTDVQDTDHIVGYRTAGPGGDSRWTMAVLKAWILTFASGGGGGGAVSSVFGRTGAVVAQSGDYNAAQVGADPSGTAASAISAHLTSAHSTAALEAALGYAVRPLVVGSTGGGSADLHSIATVSLPAGTVIICPNGAVGERFLQIVAGTLAEDVASGVYRPTDYNASTNAKVLKAF